jgi:beta-galactosidase
VHQPDFFPFSVWYSGGKARAPMLSEVTPSSREEWRRDLEQIKSIWGSIRCVRGWSGRVRSPGRGSTTSPTCVCCWSWREELGLRVFIQMYIDSAPDWVGNAYPHTRFVAQSGVAIPSQAAPGFCTDNHEIRELVHAVLHRDGAGRVRVPELPRLGPVERAVTSSTGRTSTSSRTPSSATATATQARFRAWLREKYGSLEALNRAWHRGSRAGTTWSRRASAPS